MPDRARKTLHLPAKPAAEPAAQPAEQAAPAKPKISPDEQRAREAADQEAKRIRIAALCKDAEALKISLIDRYPHLFAVDPPRPLASGIPPRPGETDRSADAGAETGAGQADQAQRLSGRLGCRRATL